MWSRPWAANAKASSVRIRPDRTPSRHRRDAGFTYLAVLFMVVAMGIALAAAGEVWRTVAQREKEAQLLFVGREYREAIARYFKNSSGVGEFPKSLDDLLLDRRQPQVRRYLRRLYPDPFAETGQPWGLVRLGDRITGVYSLAPGKPMRQSGFGKGEDAFADAGSYSDWRFIYLGGATTGGEGGGAIMASPAAIGVPGMPQVGTPQITPGVVPETPPRERPTDRCSVQRDSESAACFGIAEVGKRFDCLRSAALRQNACNHGGNMPPLKL